MKVNLDIRLVPALCKVVGKNRIDFEFEGETIRNMIEGLVSKYGLKAHEALYDSRGCFDGMIQIILNKEKWITSDRLETPLKHNDNVSLMLLIAGG
ncbi:MAG: hypothetical protein ACE5JA_09860 [bacterium]